MSRPAAALPSRAWIIACLCALIAVLVGGLAANAARDPAGGKVSALVHLSAGEPLAAKARQSDPGFAFVPATSHYDGTYFYAVARDPLARGAEHTLIDRPAYRYGHAFYGQLAWVFSFGDRAAIPTTLLVLSLLGLGVAAACACLLASGFGWSPWCGLVVALSPGLLYATTADTAEPVAAAFLGLALLAWTRRSLVAAGVALVALALTKEPLSLVPVGIFVFEAVRVWRRDRQVVPRAWTEQRRRFVGALAALAAGPVALIGWLLYVDHQFGVWPLGQNPDLLGRPFAGIHQTLKQAAGQGFSDFANSQLGAAALPIVVALFVAFAVGIVCALRLRTVVDGVFLLTAPLMFLLGPLDLLYPKDLLRITVVPVLLLPAVLRGARVTTDRVRRAAT